MSRRTPLLVGLVIGAFLVLALQIALDVSLVLVIVPLTVLGVVAGVIALRPPLLGLRIGLAALTVAGVVVHATVVTGDDSGTWWSIALASVVAAVTAWWGALLSDERRAGLLVAGGLLAFQISVVFVIYVPPAGYPSWQGAGMVLFYPLLLGALVLYLRRRLSGAGATAWLDIAIGGVALATITNFVLLGPALDHEYSRYATAEHVNALGNYLLLGTIVAATAVAGAHLGRRMLLLGIAVGLFTLADTDFVLSLVNREIPTAQAVICWTVAFGILAWVPWAPARAAARLRGSRLRTLVPALAGPLVLPPLLFGDLQQDGGWQVVNVAGALIVLSLVGLRLLLTLRDNGRLLAQTDKVVSRTQAILDCAGEGIVGLDADGVVTFANPAALGLMGRSDDEVVGRPWQDVLTIEGETLALAIADTLLEGTSQPPADLTLVGSGGWQIAVQCTTTPVESGGWVAGAVVTITDVTERIAAAEAVQRSEEHLALAQSLAGIGSWEWRVAESAVHWSEEQARLHGIENGYVPPTLDDLLGLILDEDQAPVREAFEHTWRSGEPLCTEYRVPASDGMRLIRVDGERLADDDGTRIGIFGTSQDVTDRLRREEAERASRAKSEFMSRMSHELRTPLNAILGFGQLLEMTELTSQQESNVNQILTAGTHLLGLIDEVLDIARIEAGRLSVSVEPVDVAATVAEAAQLTGPLSAERGIEVELDLPAAGAWARADAQRLRQVVLNLVSNGIKYNSVAGHLRLAVAARDGEVFVEVADTGPGIPPGDLCRLFNAFERLDADAGFVEGTGLGLAVSKGLVEAMGGRIDVESTVGLGTIFRIALPAGEARTLAEAAGLEDPMLMADGGAAARSADPGAPTAVAHRLLCIEDNATNLALVQGILGGRGDVELAGACDAASGLAAIRERCPDIVLLDLNLPDGHGADLLRELRADPATASVPVVVLSADATRERMRDAMDAGADVYLTKPLDVIELLTTVEDVLSRAA